MAPNVSVNVTHISRQYFVLGQLDSGLWAGDQDSASGKGNYLLPLAPVGPFTLWVGTSMWPST